MNTTFTPDPAFQRQIDRDVKAGIVGRGAERKKATQTIQALRRVVKALENLGAIADGIDADASLDTYRQHLAEAIAERETL